MYNHFVMTKKALLIGINYNGTSACLQGCINDIKNINELLTSHYGYSPKHIKILVDEGEERGAFPTRDNIASAISWLVSNNKKGDKLFFYYSGHGNYIMDSNADESDRQDEVIIPLDFDQHQYIADDFLFANLTSKIDKGVTLHCFSDSCFSGTIFDNEYNCRSKSECKKTAPRAKRDVPRGTMPDSKKPFLYIPSDWTEDYEFSMEYSKNAPGNVIAFSGCLDTEVSADAYIENVSQGAFTYCFIRTLQRNSKDIKRGKVKVKEILKEINCNLSIYGFNQQHTQLSVSSNNLLDASFVL
ncbi:MAG: caspase family protein [Alphaproteobacteria bacterium]|nr:MAG: caspase family protein [Alphaproteobacteria bacterium]